MSKFCHDGHVHEVDGFGGLTEFPCEAGECIHCVLERIPFECVELWVFVGMPDTDDIIDKSSVVNDASGVMLEKFFFMDSIIDGGIWRCRWRAHCVTIQLFEGKIPEIEDVQGHD